MDQGRKETRDFLANEGDDHDNVNLVDIELKPQIEEKIQSSPDLLEEGFNLSFASKAADPKAISELQGTPTLSKLFAKRYKIYIQRLTSISSSGSL